MVLDNEDLEAVRQGPVRRLAGPQSEGSEARHQD